MCTWSFPDLEPGPFDAVLGFNFRGSTNSKLWWLHDPPVLLVGMLNTRRVEFAVVPRLVSSQHDRAAEFWQVKCFSCVYLRVHVHVPYPDHPSSPGRQMASQKKAHDERRNPRLSPTTAQLEQ